MRKDLLAFGIIISLVGLVFIVTSQTVVKPEPVQSEWIPVEEVNSEEQPSQLLSVQGPLNQEDEFRVYFGIVQVGSISTNSSVKVNLTDPKGQVTPYNISVGRSMGQGGSLEIKSPFPQGVANDTGTYKVDAEGIGGISLVYLALQKMKLEEKEPQYPYSIFFSIGIAILLTGGGIFFLGAKISKQRRRLRKHKAHFFVHKYWHLKKFWSKSSLSLLVLFPMWCTN